MEQYFDVVDRFSTNDPVLYYDGEYPQIIIFMKDGLEIDRLVIESKDQLESISVRNPIVSESGTYVLSVSRDLTITKR